MTPIEFEGKPLFSTSVRTLEYFNDLQLKNISRELNYDVIIERTEEGILCRENHQFYGLRV